MPNGALVQLKRGAKQAEIVDVPAQKRRMVATPIGIQAQVRGEALASSTTAQQRNKARQLEMQNDFKARRATMEEKRIRKRETDLVKHRAAPPEARIRAMPSARNGGGGDAVRNLKITTPVFGDTNDGGTLKKEITLVESGRYTFPGELLLKIWSSEQPVPRKLLITEKNKNHTTGKVTESRSSGLAKYLLRLKKTELVEEDRDGFRLSNNFKPWMLTGVPSTSAKFKPSVPGLFEAHSWSERRDFFRELHEQAGGLQSVK